MHVSAIHFVNRSSPHTAHTTQEVRIKKSFQKTFAKRECAAKGRKARLMIFNILCSLKAKDKRREWKLKKVFREEIMRNNNGVGKGSELGFAMLCDV